MSTPLYGCSNIGCAEECSYPADMLHVYQGEAYCQYCWEDMQWIYPPGTDPDDEDAEPLRWRDLEPFVPEHEKRIALLENLLRAARRVITDATIGRDIDTALRGTL